MARGRFLSDSVAKDKRLNDLPLDAAFVYLMAIPHLDRDGIIDGDAAVLWGTICPRRRELLDQMERIIAEWVAAGLVVRYETDEGTALWFPGFIKNQQGMNYGREAPSRFNPPPGYVRTTAGLVSEAIMTKSGPNPDEVRTNSGVSPAQVEGQVEVEVKVKDQVVAASAAAFSTDAETVVRAWQDNEMSGKPIGVLRDSLCQLTDLYGTPAMLQAIAIACERDKRTLSYVRGILRKGVSAPSNGASPPSTSPYAGWVLVRDDEGGEA